MKIVLTFCFIIFISGFIPNAQCEVNLYLEHCIQDSSEKITAVSFSPDNNLIAFGNEEGQIIVLNLETGKRENFFNYHDKKISHLEFSRSGRCLASASADKTVRLLDLENDKPPTIMKSFSGRARTLAFSDDDRYLAADGDDEDIFIWEIPSGHLRSRLKGHEDDILDIAFNLSEGTVISVGCDNKMIIWDHASMKLLRQYELGARTISNSGIDLTCARVSVDRLFVAAGIDEHILRKGGRGMMFKYHLAFFDISKGVLLKILEDNTHKIKDMALYPENCFVAFDNSTLRSKKLALRNIESGSFDLNYNMDANCTRLAFSPDGKWLAGAVEPSKDSKEPRLYLWKVHYEIPPSGCFMGRIRLTSSDDPVLSAGVPKVAAIVPFGISGTDKELGNSAAHFLESKLAKNPYLKLVERSRVSDIIKELEFQRSDLVDKDKAVKIGKILGAALIITGNVDRVGADLVISARIIDVETGGILGVKEVHCGQCGADDIYDAIAILAPTLVEY